MKYILTRVILLAIASVGSVATELLTPDKIEADIKTEE